MVMDFKIHKEDALPKVIVCGATDTNVPKLLVCTDRYKEKETPCPGPCSKDEKEIPHKPIKPPQLQTPVPYMITAPRPPPPNPLAIKNQTIANLKRQLCEIQCQMDELISENAALTEKIMNASREEKGVPDVGSKLDQYAKATKALQKQLGEMESNVKAMRTELTEVKESRPRMHQEEGLGGCPPGWFCGMMKPPLR